MTTETNCTNRSQKQTEQIQTQIQTKPITKRNQLQNKTNCKTRPTANAYTENATVLISYQNQINNKSIQCQLNSNNKNAQLSTRSKLLRRSHFREQAGYKPVLQLGGPAVMGSQRRCHCRTCGSAVPEGLFSVFAKG